MPTAQRQAHGEAEARGIGSVPKLGDASGRDAELCRFLFTRRRLAALGRLRYLVLTLPQQTVERRDQAIGRARLGLQWQLQALHLAFVEWLPLERDGLRAAIDQKVALPLAQG